MPKPWQTQLKSFLQLGLEQTGLYGIYQLGLKTGHIARQTPIHAIKPAASDRLAFPWTTLPPERLAASMHGSEDLLRKEADEILDGKFRCFGGPLQPILLRPETVPPAHWTVATSEALDSDIKWLWEPARFGWAYTLARAYARLGDDRYAQSFWERLEEFIAFNPANAGPNWASAQEVAVRLMAVAFAAGVFRASPQSSPERMRLLRGFFVAHAERIPVTLAYSQAQNNNHLLTEAAGLWTAACLLPDHPQARRWNALGQANFNRGILKQVALDGSYAQYSTNYHRVMLHCALWIVALYQGAKPVQDIFTAPNRKRLCAAVRWLLDQTDMDSGQAPNYGHNDGANLLPLASTRYEDFRPTLQAAGRVFLDAAPFPPGPWDEACLWLSCPEDKEQASVDLPTENPAVLRLSSTNSWAVMRANIFHSRPAHADQLHVDLWFKGQALALDAGTFSYNAPPPWENALAGVAVHNTLQIDHMEPMTRAGRFLWLDWDQAGSVRKDTSTGEIIATRKGYRRIGVQHERHLCNPSPDEWLILDRVTAIVRRSRPHTIRLHWLVADLPWSLKDATLELYHPAGTVRLTIDSPSAGMMTLDRAGERLVGSGNADPISGWISPTYGVRLPALSLSAIWQSDLPLEIRSRWQFPE
jgi:hypothetical protein